MYIILCTHTSYMYNIVIKDTHGWNMHVHVHVRTHQNISHGKDTELVQRLTHAMKRPITTVSPFSEYLIPPGRLITALCISCLELWLARVQ